MLTRVSIDNIELPELVNLPVYRTQYLSQEKTDELCKILWGQKPDFVKQLVYQEKLPFPNNRDAIFGRMMGDIIYFFRQEEKEQCLEPISMTAMVDLTYEIDRRVRHALGLEDIKPVGEPIADGPDGPFPSVDDYPVTLLSGKQGKMSDLDPSISEKGRLVIKTILNQNPEVLFAYHELWRRSLRTGEPEWVLTKVRTDIDKGLSPNIKNILESF